MEKLATLVLLILLVFAMYHLYTSEVMPMAGGYVLTERHCAEDEVLDWIADDVRGCVHIDELCQEGR